MIGLRLKVLLKVPLTLIEQLSCRRNNTDVIAITKLASWIGDGRGIGLSGGDLDLEISGSDATTLSCGEDHRAIKLSENIPRIANGVVGDICATIVPDDG